MQVWRFAPEGCSGLTVLQREEEDGGALGAARTLRSEEALVLQSHCHSHPAHRSARRRVTCVQRTVEPICRLSTLSIPTAATARLRIK
jgi:hypothetical protein